MDLSPTHFHLLLNHFPTIGFIIGIVLFVAGLIARSDHIKQAALVVFVAIALLTIPTYCTGNMAERALRANPDAPKQLMLEHESAAFFSLMVMCIAGGFAWLGLWQYRRMLHLPRWNVAVILLLAAVTLGLVSRAANIGGEIRHPEIRVVQQAEAKQAEALPLGLWMARVSTPRAPAAGVCGCSPCGAAASTAARHTDNRNMALDTEGDGRQFAARASAARRATRTSRAAP